MTTMPAMTPALDGFAERRQATFVFTDLVGSTQLSLHLDPEDLMDVMVSYQDAILTSVERFSGTVERVDGDGIMSYFGWPTADEENVTNAVEAALACVASVLIINSDIGRRLGIELAVRVGVATGVVVAAATTTRRSGDFKFLGPAPSLAARLQSLAEANSVVASAATHRVAGPAFTWQDLGLQKLRGFDEPLQVFQVLGRRRSETRLQRRLHRVRTSMVNRSSELEFLRQRWRQAVEGKPQAVLVTGDPGIGKSRLLQALLETVPDRDWQCHHLQCSASLVNTALHPHIDYVQREAGIDEGDPAPKRLAKLRSVLSKREADFPETVALLAALLSIPTDDDLPQVILSPLLQRQRTMSALIRLLLYRADDLPSLVIFEDVHWLDPTSAALLEQLISEMRGHRLFLLATARSGANDLPWPEHPDSSILPLMRLTLEHTSEMVTSLAAASDMPSLTQALIVTRTDGVPLFIEELTQMVLDKVPGIPAMDLPETLLDLLAERLGRLGSARRLAQIGAVIGREFPVSLVAAMSDSTAADIQADLDRLLDSGLVQETRTDGVLTFKHALIQDAAYQSILMRTRRVFHARIAAIIVNQFPYLAKAEPEGVARHLTRAGGAIEAASWWLQAGGQAIRRGAPREAVAHYTAGLAALEALPKSESRDRAELTLLAGLGPARMVMHGPGDPEFGKTQQIAFQTMCRLPDRPAQFPITYGLALHHWGRSELDQAALLARLLLDVASKSRDPEHIMAANNISAMIAFHAGRPLEAQRLLRESTRLYERTIHASLYPRYMMDFGVFGRFYLALSTCIAGDPDDATQIALEAAELAVAIGQPHSRGFSMLANFIVSAFREDLETSLQWAADCIAFCDEQGFPEFVALGVIVKGWAMARKGLAEIGLAELERGIGLWRATGFESWQSWFSALRADILLSLGRVSEALNELVSQRLRIAANGESIFESLLISLHASALAMLGADPVQVNAGHCEAIEVAKRQGTKLWEQVCDRRAHSGVTQSCHLSRC